MNDPYRPSARNWSSGQETFPGLDPTFPGPPTEVVQTTMMPVPATAPAQQSSTSIKLPFNLSNLSDLKGLIDRMGGIDGVVATMGKVQKFMSAMQQVAPILKLFMKKGSSNDKSEGAAASRPRRRRRTARRRRAPARRRAGAKTRK